MGLLHRLKSAIPTSWTTPYHRALSWIASTWYGHPSNRLIVVGVTGTNGKTTTSYLISKALEASGFPTGCSTTAIFKVANHEWLNDTKMTMLGRFRLQRLLREMVDAGCRYAVVETSSQGILQHRHRDINYDVVVFTNLTPEHIEAHGGFEAYKRAKIELFRHTSRCPRKVFNGKNIPKVAVLNADDPAANDFAVPGFDQVVRFGINEPSAEYSALAVSVSDPRHSQFTIRHSSLDLPVSIQLPGLVNISNALAALAVAGTLDISLADASARLAAVSGVPGRFERIDEGQPWTVIVDYAPEPASLGKLYESIAALPHGKIIHVLGSAGGGRDVARRPILGRMAGENADLVIVTNEDPYDDNPREIMGQVASGAREKGKIDGETLFIIEDRREAITEAMRRAAPGDLVILTGKGCEQAIMIANGGRIPWDEREVARAAIRANL